jgi:DNA polymerase-1
MKPIEFTPSGIPQVSAPVLKKMAGSNLFGDEKDAVWGTAYGYFGGKEAGVEACRAIGALAQIGQIDATINNFLVPLQALVDKNKRIHCSLNLNTETGRLSSRRPNLQNQPALEKDQYKIRDAFVAEPGNTLIVADYGQLELRLLAHITNCQSMIDAFKSGGCFHSRTAVGMYPYVKEAVDTGKVLLEWDYSKGQPTVPLVKDTYASERRKAKTLNFSIAYGKTVHGLAADWGISTDEAQNTLEAWYRDRPEVKEWQERTRDLARREGYVRTMMGRYRRLPDAGIRGPSGSHALRAAINTPIQGSAADVVVVAMLKLHRSQKLMDLGWKLILQIHDEVILEGPKESSKEALEEVRNCMQNPFDGFGLNPLRVSLDVDAKSADSWYKAK